MNRDELIDRLDDTKEIWDFIIILGNKCHSCLGLNYNVTGQSEIAIHPSVI